MRDQRRYHDRIPDRSESFRNIPILSGGAGVLIQAKVPLLFEDSDAKAMVEAAGVEDAYAIRKRF